MASPSPHYDLNVNAFQNLGVANVITVGGGVMQRQSGCEGSFLLDETMCPFERP